MATSGKKTGARKTSTKKTTTRKKAAGAGLARAARQLVNTLEERGLFDQDELARLETSVQEIDAATGDAETVKRLASLHRKIMSCLSNVGAYSEAVRVRKLEALFEINRLVSHTAEPQECFDLLLQQIRRLIPYEGATLFLADSREGRLNVAAQVGPEIDLIDRIQFDQGAGFSGWVAQTQKPVLFGSLKRSQPSHKGLIKAFMAVPLVVGAQTVGVITLGHSEEGIFTKDDLQMLSLVASQAGGVIQKTLLLEEIRELAITDDLTGLCNRRHFMLRMNHEVARASRFLQDFSVIFMDLDEFKAYNDAFGHETGDRALVELGEILRNHARATDIVARYGGEEFVLLLPLTGRHEALAMAERLRRAVESHIFPRRKRLTISVGVATFPEDSTETQEILNMADKALYQAKREGRNRIAALPAAAA